MEQIFKKYIFKYLRKAKYDINRMKKLKIKKIYNPHKLRVHTISLKNRHVFAGYYDKNPYSNLDKKILFVTCDRNLENSRIGYYDLDEHKIVIISEVFVNSWQMGPRLLWYKQGQIFFNNFNNGMFSSKVIDVDGNVMRNFSFPLYEISNNRKFGIGLDFSLLHLLRDGYGYNSFNTTIENYYNNSENSLILYDMDKSVPINSLRMTDFLKKFPVLNKEKYYHYFNHVSFNTDDNYFLFFHLWKNSQTGQLSNRLLIANTKLEIIFVLEEDNKVSHYTWKKKDELLITTYENDKCKYKLYKFDFENKAYTFKYLSGLIGDGHPTYIRENTFITDTYPDKSSYQSLFSYDNKTGERIDLLEIYSDPKQFNVERCDLHPKVSSDSDIVSFDSTHLGYRTLSYFSISQINE